MDYHAYVDIASISPEQVQAYIDKMAQRGESFSLINQLHSAVVYYFSRVEPASSFSLDKLVRPKEQKKLPKFLSKTEIARLFEHIENLKHLAIVYILYGSGLRRGELISIKLKDIYWDRNQILIEDGKGGKDRMVNLGHAAKVVLESYFHAYKPQMYLFEGKTEGQPYSASSVSKIIARATRRAGIHKRVTPHMLRHSFATHLMDSGIALPKIQKLLGHKDVKTTMIYTHVTTNNLSEVLSPLDMLKKVTSDNEKVDI